MTPRDIAILRAAITNDAPKAALLAILDVMGEAVTASLPVTTERDIEPVTVTSAPSHGAERTRKWREKITSQKTVTIPSDQSTNILINNLSVDAREAPAIAEAVTRLCGKRIHHLDEEIAGHLSDGVPAETILATVRMVNQRKRGPPGSARYYAKEIRAAHAQMRLPLQAAAAVATGPPRSAFAERWAANTAKQLAEREEAERRHA